MTSRRTYRASAVSEIVDVGLAMEVSKNNSLSFVPWLGRVTITTEYSQHQRDITILMACIASNSEVIFKNWLG